MRTRKQVARRRGTLVLLISLTALILVLGWWHAHARRANTPAPIDQLLLEFLAPSMRFTGTLRNRLTPGPTYSVAPLTAAGMARLRQLEEENSRLRTLLMLRDAHPTGGLAVEVIGRTPGSLIVDKGAVDGVAVQMVALTPDGVLGQVFSVTPHTATLLPLTDANSGIGAMTERTRALGVLKGSRAGTCELIYLSGNADVRVNDLVVTSGPGNKLPSIFPRGLPLGRVTGVVRNTALSSRIAAVRPAVNPAVAEMVVLIKNGDR